MKSGIPVIRDWSLTGNLRDGYILTGHVGDTTVHGKVTAQEGNYITLSNTKYLVIWRNIVLDPLERMQVLFNGKYCDLKVGRDFSEYMHDSGVRPHLMG